MEQGKYWMSDEKWTQRIDCVNLDMIGEPLFTVVEWNIISGNKRAKWRKRHWAAIRILLRDVEGAISHCNHNVRDKLGRFTKVKQ